MININVHLWSKMLFGQDIWPKAHALDKKVVQFQPLDLEKGPSENVLSFPNLKFRLDK
jgi:hypothetical protein